MKRKQEYIEGRLRFVREKCKVEIFFFFENLW